MIKNIAIAAWLSLVVFGQATFAEQIASSLPKDGTWVTYNISAQPDNSVQVRDSADSDDSAQFDDELLRPTKKTVTISLVGSAKERVGECRWVELKYVDAGDDPGVSVYKCLIPEKALREADRPMLYVVRAWVKHNDEEAEELTPAILAGGDPEHFCSLDDEMLFWPGVLRRCERISSAKAVKFRDREIVISEGLAGKAVREYTGSRLEDKRIETVEYQMWMHRGIAIGFAYARVRNVSTGDNPIFPPRTTEWTVVDTGDNAKTSLPENN
jgi:hypothetical protein